MIIGTSIARIEKATKCMKISSPSIQSIYGFGSYFRGDKFRDIDLLFVMEGDQNMMLSTCEDVRASCKNLGAEIGCIVDPLFLTQREHSAKPLRDMHELRLLL